MPSRNSSALALAIAAALIAGCSQLSLGQCTTAADCTAGATCDTTQSPPVCVIEPGTCFPSCRSGESCRSGVCVAQGCTPACTATQICDLDGGVCVGATQAEVAITSPITNTFVGASLAATVDAIAPGGVSAVRLELDKNGQPIAQGDAAAMPTSGDAANWAGSISLAALNSSADGPAQLVAIATISGGGSGESPAITVRIDLTPPTIAMITDGRSAVYAGGATVQIRAQLSDTGSGFLPGAQAKLTFTGVNHAAILGPVTNGVATFTVPLDDVLAPPSIDSTITFSVTAMDAVGNSATLTGDAKQVILVDRKAPAGTITGDAAWHSQASVVQVSGTLSDPGGSISGGLAAVQLTHAGAVVGTATISTSSNTTGTWTGTIDLSAQTFAAGFEGSWAFTARFLDAAGNSSTADSTLLVDNAPPQISTVQVLTPAFDGGSIYAAGPNLAITAQISDGSGVAGASLAFQGQPAIAGTTIDGGAWSFSVPRPSGTYDGVTVPFSITASDLFADAGLSPGAAAVHTATADETGLTFDNKPPAVVIAASNNWYVRALPDGGAAVLEIDATITDNDGLAGAPTLTPQGGSAIAGSAGSGGVYKFFVDPAQEFAANDAGPLDFTVAATDLAGNSGSAAGSRNIDSIGPVLSGLSIYLTGAAPDAGVVYPASAAATGHDGKHFIYNDAITIAGTLTDRAGFQSVSLQINGAFADGGPSIGAPIPIHCGSNGTCILDQSVALNAAGNGALTSPFVDGGLPAGSLNVTLVATDGALLPDGGPANQSLTSAPTAINVTRYLWRQVLPHVLNTASSTSPSNVGAGIVGISIHPDGDLIVTGNADSTKNADMIFAVRDTGPNADGGANLDWTWGGKGGTSGASVGNPTDSPAIGEGGATSALIYVATPGFLTALQPDGGTQWQFAQADLTFSAAPAVLETNITVGNAPPQNAEEVIASADPNAGPATTPLLVGAYLLPGDSAPTVATATLSASAQDCPPLALDNELYLGTENGVFSVYKLTNNGNFADAGSVPTDGAGFLEPITNRDGSALIVSFADASDAPIYETDLTTAVPTALGTYAGISAPPILDANGALYVSTSDDKLYAVQTEPAGTPQLITTLSAPGQAAVAGSDGHVYLPYDSGNLFAFQDGAVVWSFSRDHKISPMATIDCQGILYVGSGQSLYAFVTDDHGLADSGWPQHRRDARSSGNASAPKYGIRAGGVCTQ